MSNPKRHHIVPELIQQRFVDPKGFLYWARFSEDDTRFGKSKPNDVFVESHLYTTIAVDGTKDAAAERWLQNIESTAAPIIENLLPSVRNRSRPALSANDGRDLLKFFMVQWYRSPEAQREAMSDAEASQRIDRLLADIIHQYPMLSVAAERYKISQKANLIKSTRATVITFDREHIVDILEERGIAFLRNAHPTKHFILGSRPLVKLAPKGHHTLRNPAVEMWLPIAPDIAIGLGQGARRLSLFDVSERQVEDLNLSIARQSTVIASGLEAVTKSVAGLR